MRKLQYWLVKAVYSFVYFYLLLLQFDAYGSNVKFYYDVYGTYFYVVLVVVAAGLV